MAGPSASSDPLAAGPAAALVLEVAAGLAELTASLAGHDQVVSRARTLRGDANALGCEDAEAYAERLRGDSEARERTIELPARMAELAAEIGEVTTLAAELGKPDSRYDSIAGALLAESAARVAVLLLEANLDLAPDARLDRARDAAQRASSAVRRALATTLPPRAEGQDKTP